MSDNLRTVLTQAIYDAPNGIDGDQLADMLMEDFRITGKTPEECRAQIVAVCQSVADAALAAIEASGTHVVCPVEPTEDMKAAAVEGGWTEFNAVAWHIYREMLAARPRDAAPTDKEAPACEVCGKPLWDEEEMKNLDAADFATDKEV